jgi:hypothetical protein
MKMTILAAFAALTMATCAFADTGAPKNFECSGIGLDTTPFTLAPNTGVMPLAVLDGRTVSISYTETNGQDTFALIIQGKDANGNDNSQTITGSALGDVYYVDGSFWVLCRPAAQQ